jgi:RHS repeat-associated protein
VLDNNKAVVSANDFDAWGYYLESRTYSVTNIKNKFTGKERDTESSYDYFGARYYDARIANWLSIDPLMEKHTQWSPYNYVLRNPMVLIDPDGKQIHFSTNQNIRDEEIFYVTRQLNPAIGRLIEITNDLTILHIVTPKIGMDFNYSNLWSLETNNKTVTFQIVNSDEQFSFQDSPEKKLVPVKTTFDEIKAKTGLDFGGYTLPSGLSATPEEPETFSPNNETIIVINKKYGKYEGVLSMAEELMHASRYISGKTWKHKHGAVHNLDVNEAAKSAIDLAEKNYKLWEN